MIKLENKISDAFDALMENPGVDSAYFHERLGKAMEKIMGPKDKRVMRVFDWDKAERIIKDIVIRNASAGLAEDWAATAGEIVVDGIPVIPTECHAFLSSVWATPVLFNDDTAQVIECWKYEEEAA